LLAGPARGDFEQQLTSRRLRFAARSAVGDYYIFQAGQPDWVRAEYERAMGIGTRDNGPTDG
jgi:hypothetical protein